MSDLTRLEFLYKRILLTVGFLLQYIFCQPSVLSFNKINQLKINQFQVIGSHNSYRLRMDENVSRWLSKFDSGAAKFPGIDETKFKNTPFT